MLRRGKPPSNSPRLTPFWCIYLVCLLIWAIANRHILRESLAHPPYVAYSVAEGVLTEAVGPRPWGVPSNRIVIAPYDQCKVAVYPEPLEPYLLESTVRVPGRGVQRWKCKIYYLMNPRHGDSWHIDWITVDGKKVLDNGESCVGPKDICPQW